MSPTSGPVTYPLSVNGYGIRVRSNLVTDNFQLLTNHGPGKFLVSDFEGNGIWTTVLPFSDDDWLPESFPETGLYLNNKYDNVGIGTPHPRANLEIVNQKEDSVKASVILNRVRYEHNPLTNEIQFHLDNVEKWAVGTHLNDDHPNSFFIWNALHNIPELFYAENGNIGLSTVEPTAKLEVLFNDDKKAGFILNQTSENVSTNEIEFLRNGEEKWAIGTHLNDDHENSFFVWSQYQGKTALLIKQNGMIGINTNDPTAQLDVNGTLRAESIGIGTHAPNDPNWKLNVNGGIWAREVKVTVEAFPDYVFSNDYPLLSIADYDKFIAENKHLPGLPSSAEVNENNGIELGKMQTKLVEKIEEQALYIILLQKQIDELKQMIGNKKEN